MNHFDSDPKGQKMKICHITTVHNALDTRIFYKEAHSLRKAGYKVHIVGIHPKKEILDGIEIIPLNSSKNRLLRMVLKPIEAFFLSIRTGSKIFHFHDPEFIPMGILLNLLGKKVIYDAHEDYPRLIMVKEWVPINTKFILSWLIAFFERFSSRFFHLTIAPSDPLSKRLPRGIALYNYPSASILNLLKKHSKPYNERDIDLIHLGVLRKTRLNFLINVLRQVDNRNVQIKSAFVGLSKEQIEYIKERLSDLNNLILLERIPFSEVVKLLGRSKIGLNYHPLEPHLEYAVPVKIFEYMAAGCVAISSDFPFLKAIMNNYSPVIFVNHDYESFTEAIMELLRTPDKIEELGKLSQYFSFNFTWNNEEKKLLEAYRRLSEIFNRKC